MCGGGGGNAGGAENGEGVRNVWRSLFHRFMAASKRTIPLACIFDAALSSVLMKILKLKFLAALNRARPYPRLPVHHPPRIKLS